jgi:hypothetical protein
VIAIIGAVLANKGRILLTFGETEQTELVNAWFQRRAKTAGNPWAAALYRLYMITILSDIDQQTRLASTQVDGVAI